MPPSTASRPGSARVRGARAADGPAHMRPSRRTAPFWWRSEFARIHLGRAGPRCGNVANRGGSAAPPRHRWPEHFDTQVVGRSGRWTGHVGAAHRAAATQAPPNRHGSMTARTSGDRVSAGSCTGMVVARRHCHHDRLQLDEARAIRPLIGFVVARSYSSPVTQSGSAAAAAVPMVWARVGEWLVQVWVAEWARASGRGLVRASDAWGAGLERRSCA